MIPVLIMSVLLLWFCGCAKDELREPAEYRSFSPNIPSEREPMGYMKWTWGTPPDSVYWIDQLKGKISLTDLTSLNPDWIITRKSGNSRYSINLLPTRYRTAYGITFSEVHLFFKVGYGLAGWQRVIEVRSPSASNEETREIYRIFEDSLKKDMGNPYNLTSKNYGKGNKRQKGLLWKGNNSYITLILYSREDGSLRLYNEARILTR